MAWTAIRWAPRQLTDRHSVPLVGKVVKSHGAGCWRGVDVRVTVQMTDSVLARINPTI